MHARAGRASRFRPARGFTRRRFGGVPQQNMHVNDIVPRPLVSLNIDYGQTGVGGDNSWGARTLPQYSLTQPSYRYGIRIQPVAGSLDAFVSRRTDD